MLLLDWMQTTLPNHPPETRRKTMRSWMERSTYQHEGKGRQTSGTWPSHQSTGRHWPHPSQSRRAQLCTAHPYEHALLRTWPRGVVVGSESLDEEACSYVEVRRALKPAQSIWRIGQQSEPVLPTRPPVAYHPRQHQHWQVHHDGYSWRMQEMMRQHIDAVGSFPRRRTWPYLFY